MTIPLTTFRSLLFKRGESLKLKTYITKDSIIGKKESFMKLSMLWFDEIFISNTDKFFLDAWLFDSEFSPQLADQVKTIINPIHVTSGGMVGDLYSKFKDTSILNSSIAAVQKFDAVNLIVEKDRDLYNQALLIAASIAPWLDLRRDENCTFTPSKREEFMIRHLLNTQINGLSKQGTSHIEGFSEVLTSRIPNLEEYNWNQVLELRNHKYYESFREKLVMLNNLANTNDNKNLKEIMEQLERKELVNIAKLHKPNPLRNIIKSCISNFPTPIPVNPFGIIDSVTSVKKEIHANKELGWLYFMIDLD